MTKRMVLLTTLIVSLVILPGCPGAGLGVWAFFPNGVGDPLGLDLQASGDAVQFPLSNVGFAGTLSWERITDTEILIRQADGDDTWVYYFILTSSTTMSGGRVKLGGQDAGSGKLWTAMKQ